MRYLSSHAKQLALSSTLAINLQLVKIVIPRPSFLLQKQINSPSQTPTAAINGYDPPDARWKSPPTIRQRKHSFENKQ